MHLKEFKINKKQAEILLNHDESNVPHIIFAGSTGTGKLTSARAFISHLTKLDEKYNLKTLDVKTSSKVLEVKFFQNSTTIEINPSGYRKQDGLIIQTILKQVAETKPINNLLNKKSAQMKYVIILDGHLLSNEAQAALRRTMEKFSSCFRLFIICDELGSIIDPIKSRVLFIKFEGLNKQDMIMFILDANKKMEYNISTEIIEQIADISLGNLSKALSLLKINSLAQLIDKNISKEELLVFEWMKEIDKIVFLILNGPKKTLLHEIRRILFSLISTCVPAGIILEEIFKKLFDSVPDELKIDIVDLGCLYSKRLKYGNKSIIHLEAFVFKAIWVMNYK